MSGSSLPVIGQERANRGVVSRWTKPRLGLAPPACLPADDEGLDVIPAVAIRGVRNPLLELSEEVGEQPGGPRFALAREGAPEERPAPCSHAPHVPPREGRWIVVPVGIVETKELGALELE